jgi:16S rRNA processing protein RimM
MLIREAKEHGDSVVACPAESIDRDIAESLKGARIFVPRSSFPTTQKDEFYWVDLIGLSVHNREGLDLGTVIELMATGPQTVLVLSQTNPEDPAKPVERMIPFVSAYVDKVDIENRLILVDWLADY